MKNSRILVPVVVSIGLAVSACQDQGTGTKQGVGSLLGAVVGGVLGSKVGKGTGKKVAIGAGAIAGALLGGEIGKSLDRADRLAMGKTTQATLETGKIGHTVVWRNPDSGNSGTITPRKTYQTQSGQYCREYQQTVSIAGETQQAYGTACRQPDGTWKIVE